MRMLQKERHFAFALPYDQDESEGDDGAYERFKAEREERRYKWRCAEVTYRHFKTGLEAIRSQRIYSQLFLGEPDEPRTREETTLAQLRFAEGQLMLTPVAHSAAVKMKVAFLGRHSGNYWGANFSRHFGTTPEQISEVIAADVMWLDSRPIRTRYGRLAS